MKNIVKINKDFYFFFLWAVAGFFYLYLYLPRDIFWSFAFKYYHYLHHSFHFHFARSACTFFYLYLVEMFFVFSIPWALSSFTGYKRERLIGFLMTPVLYNIYLIISDLLAYWNENELIPDWIIGVNAQRLIIHLIIFPSLSYVSSMMGNKLSR